MKGDCEWKIRAVANCIVARDGSAFIEGAACNPANYNPTTLRAGINLFYSFPGNPEFLFDKGYHFVEVFHLVHQTDVDTGYFDKHVDGKEVSRWELDLRKTVDELALICAALMRANHVAHVEGR
jgi:hypothetical protein